MQSLPGGMSGVSLSGERFALARMSPLIRNLTLVLLAVPIVMVVAGILRVAIAVAAIYAFVWLWFRPSWFAVTPTALIIRWPLRRACIPRNSIVACRIVDGARFRHEYGRGLRIGAGGLWGGFGWLKTRSVTWSMYVSRTDDLVLVERGDARPLLLTPERANDFVRRLAPTS